jgi:hypothetical protein
MAFYRRKVMTITEMVAIMLAYENGAKIEFRNDDVPEWSPIEEPSFLWGWSEYRVAEFPQEQDGEINRKSDRNW